LIVTGLTPAPGSRMPSPGPGRTDGLFPDSVRRLEDVLALRGEPGPGAPMSADPKRVKELFLEAAELPDEAARSAFLDRACGEDTDLRSRVETLLRSHDPAGSFLDTPAAVIPDPDHAVTRAFTPDADTRTGDGAGESDEVPLGFLAPATRPDSLGRI